MTIDDMITAIRDAIHACKADELDVLEALDAEYQSHRVRLEEMWQEVEEETGYVAPDALNEARTRIRELRDRIAQLEEATRWRDPVKEPPKEGVRVLFSVGENVHHGYYSPQWEEQRAEFHSIENDGGWQYAVDDVQGWKPIPLSRLLSP